MKLLYVHDNIYFSTELGEVYSQGQFPHSYFEPFINAFEKVVVVGRRKPLDRNLDLRKLNVSSGEGLEFELLADVNSPKNLVRNYDRVSASLEILVEEADAVVIRAVSDLGWIAYKHARAKGKPLAMEMAACAWDSTWNHGHYYGKAYAPIRFFRDKAITRNADYTLYVSQSFLQSRYPTKGKTAVASNVRLKAPNPEMLEKRIAKIDATENDEISFVGLIGTVGHKLKGIHVALKALARIEQRNPGRFIFRVLGPGNPEPYRTMAESLGLGHCVFFDGVVQTGPEVFAWLENVDVYIQPSYQEGVPRATIEAMSVACPVVASTAGGIPELIPEEWLHNPGDVNRLEIALEKMLSSRIHQKEAARTNFKRAQDYTSEKLMPIRNGFWQDFAAFAASKAN
jgi:glycosyltransferase involved in cell wall biosynthesis